MGSSCTVMFYIYIYILYIKYNKYFCIYLRHVPATPALWYQNRFNDSKYKVPRTPNFNIHSPNKHWLVDRQPELDDIAISYMDQWWKNRLRYF